MCSEWAQFLGTCGVWVSFRLTGEGTQEANSSLIPPGTALYIYNIYKVYAVFRLLVPGIQGYGLVFDFWGPLHLFLCHSIFFPLDWHCVGAL